ncbi:MAG: 3-hydroxyacyl-ACP dehydratase FabZ [Planctomycetota bacterium]|nr:3-hydroxyacyl-ACP dehydratase FabZ [Planctomycetota bacterium]
MSAAPDPRAILPHRPPMLLLDRVVELIPGVRAVARKTVAADEYWLSGHFPGHPVLPGVLLVEALAQTAGLALRGGPRPGGPLKTVLASISSFRFRRPVVPGDVLELCAEHRRSSGKLHRYAVRAEVGGVLCGEGELTLAEGTRNVKRET